MNLSKELLVPDIPSLSPDDTGETVLSLMEEHKISHLALVENGKYLCLVSERDAYRLESPDSELGKAWYFSPSVKISDNLIDVLERITSNNLTILPVVSEDNDYLGVISQPKLLNELSALLGADRSGAILVIEIPEKEFLVSEIARIVESNNAQIINLFTTISPAGNWRVALKVTVDEADHIVRSFERFNFSVIMNFSKNGASEDVIHERWQELFHYINM